MAVACVDFLFGKRADEAPGLVVVFGGESFLTRQARQAIREWVIKDAPEDFTFTEFTGDEVTYAEVMDELFTPPFVGEQRLVVVEDADKFITAHRGSLEKFEGSSCGVLLLEPKSWTKSTKLAKAAEKTGLVIEAKAPDKPSTAESWCTQWAKKHYRKKLPAPAAAQLVESIGTNLGQLDQELFKLTNYVGDDDEITFDTVVTLVAGTHAEETYKLLGHALEGALPRALSQLDRMLVSGTAPQLIHGMLVSQLRKLTHAARLVVAGQRMNDALKEAGIYHPFAIKKAEQQLRFLGRQRMAGMYRRLLEADFHLKGGSSLPYQTVVERLLVELSAAQKSQRQNQ